MMNKFQKTKFNFSAFFAIAFFIMAIVSCKKEESEVPITTEEFVTVEEVKNGPSTFTWYSLTKNGFKQIEKPQKIPMVLKKPWTESLRISYMAQAAESSPLDVEISEKPKVFALANRIGLIALDGKENRIYKDDSIFTNRTAEKIVFMNGTPILSVYKNSFFNEKFSTKEQFRPFLVQFVEDSGVFFPILTYENLSLDEEEHVNDFCWNGTEWFCSTKSSKKTETKFTYLKFKPETALLSISPEKNFIHIELSTEEEFRAQRSPQEFSAAPERVRELLGNMPSQFTFYAECKLAGGTTPREYLHGQIKNAAVPKATVQISDTWIAALFQDGTAYLKGALYGQKAMNGGNTIALRLPKLPQGFVYSDFGISGTTLFAAWEEYDFFKTGRAGFIEVDLLKILYNAEK